jgi:hypothetical protein
MQKKFGWWPRRSVVNPKGLCIEPLLDFDEAIAAVKADPQSYDGWFYPPLQPVRHSSREKKTAPETPRAIFNLPVTHSITATESWMDEEYIHFVIVLLGLIDGMRLVPDGWVHFYKAPVEPHKLSDLVCGIDDIAAILSVAECWWKKAADSVRQAMFAAVHWYCFSGLYRHEFEEFSAKYTVLDTLDWLHRMQCSSHRGSHAERPSKLAASYGLLTPSWAVMHGNACRLAEIRNKLIHEGQFADKPIGFAHLPEPSLTLELGHFLTRLILAMLGVKCSYVKSPVDTRSMHGLGLI